MNDDLDVATEVALAMAQSTVQQAIDKARITKAELARRTGLTRPYVSAILKGSHNLTVKTMSRCLFACGYEVAFKLRSLAPTAKKGRSNR